MPDELASVMVLEREAVAITDVQVGLIPGRAQTADYARLVLRSSGVPDSELERYVTTRIGRQTILSRDNAPQASFFLEEGALRRALGCPRVLREQLEQLLVLQRRDNVSVRVIPAADPSPANGCAFALYEWSDGTPYVFLEARGLDVFITETPTVEPFVKTCHELPNHALDEPQSSALIGQIAEGLADA